MTVTVLRGREITVRLSKISQKIGACANHTPENVEPKEHSPRAAPPVIPKEQMRPQKKKRAVECGPPLSVKESVRRSTQGYSGQIFSVKTGNLECVEDAIKMKNDRDRAGRMM